MKKSARLIENVYPKTGKPSPRQGKLTGFIIIVMRLRHLSRECYQRRNPTFEFIGSNVTYYRLQAVTTTICWLTRTVKCSSGSVNSTDLTFTPKPIMYQISMSWCHTTRGSSISTSRARWPSKLDSRMISTYVCVHSCVRLKWTRKDNTVWARKQYKLPGEVKHQRYTTQLA